MHCSCCISLIPVAPPRQNHKERTRIDRSSEIISAYFSDNSVPAAEDEYRTRYGLPSDCPSVSANDSAARSALAKALGLGNLRRKVISAPEPALEPDAKPKRAARSRKGAEPA